MRITGRIVEANTRLKETNRVRSASGGKTMRLLKGVYVKTLNALAEAMVLRITMSPTAAPRSTENATIAKSSMRSITTNCLNDKPRTLMIDASRLLSLR
jgi:hypothetical protein